MYGRCTNCGRYMCDCPPGVNANLPSPFEAKPLIRGCRKPDGRQPCPEGVADCKSCRYYFEEERTRR